MLLGQAESGKSTLQKQFQLYYASQTLDKERPAWRPVVYFNIIKAVRMILEELDYEFSQSPSQSRPQLSSVLPPTSTMSSVARGKLPALPESPTQPYGGSAANGIGSNPGFSGALGGGSGSGEGSGGSGIQYANVQGGWQEDLAQLRTKLLPLVAVEDALASDLSGGVTVAGGRTGVYVRAGWQTLVTPAMSRWPGSNRGNNGPPVNDLVARMLAATKEEVAALWNHPSVKALLKFRKLRLEESASL